MSTIKVLDRYTPSPVPYQTSPEMREWLETETERMAYAINGALQVIDLLEANPRMFLLGTADDVTPDIIADKFINYEFGFAQGAVPIEPDAAAGNITIPIDGAYRVTMYAYFLQLSVTQNESINLQLDVDGSKGIVDSVDVATNQTQDRIFKASFTRSFVAGEVLSMFTGATADMGLCTTQQVSLEVTFVTLVPDPQVFSDMRPEFI